MNRRDLLKSAAALPLLGFGSRLLAQGVPYSHPGYQVPYLPKLWAIRASEIIDLRLRGQLDRRTVIEGPPSHRFNHTYHLHRAFAFRPYDWVDEMLPQVEKEAEFLAQIILGFAGSHKWITSFYMPVNRSGSIAGGDLSHSARHVHRDLAVHALLFKDINRDNIYVGSVEMQFAFASDMD